jgi:cell division protein FtsW (lipid II flippase)
MFVGALFITAVNHPVAVQQYRAKFFYTGQCIWLLYIFLAMVFISRLVRRQINIILRHWKQNT